MWSEVVGCQPARRSARLGACSWALAHRETLSLWPPVESSFWVICIAADQNHHSSAQLFKKKKKIRLYSPQTYPTVILCLAAFSCSLFSPTPNLFLDPQLWSPFSYRRLPAGHTPQATLLPCAFSWAASSLCSQPLCHLPPGHKRGAASSRPQQPWGLGTSRAQLEPLPPKRES